MKENLSLGKLLKNKTTSAVALGAYSYMLLRLWAFLQGMLAGLRTPVNTHTGQYKSKP